MKRFVMVLFASLAIAFAGCTSSSTTGSSPQATTPPAVTTPPSGGRDTTMSKAGTGSPMLPEVPKIKIPD
jgi:hypothetical protein